MTIFLKYIPTGIVWDFNPKTEAEKINKLLNDENYELVNKKEIPKEELELIKIPTVDKKIPAKDRLLGKK